MQLTIRLDPDLDHPLQSQLFEQIRDMIIKGTLKASDPIPATRELSKQLQISRNTVVLAYERLMSEGYIETQRSVGTFVSNALPEHGLYLDDAKQKRGEANDKTGQRLPLRRTLAFNGQAPTIINPHRDRIEIDFWAGRPDPRSFPLKDWRRIINRKLLQAGYELAGYQDPQGNLALRQAIADYLGPARGISASPDQVFIIGGIQDGLNLLSHLLACEGCPVVLENPCYQGAASVFRSRKAEIHPIPVDDRGMMVERLPDLSRSIVYVTPSHQYPIGYTLSLERRVRLLEWAHETHSYVIEDDYDSDFRYVGAPLTALKGLDKLGSVIYLGTFSKCMGAALRLGFMVIPRELIEPARNLKTLMNCGQPWLEQVSMADFMTSGAFDHHLRRIRKLYLSRRDHLISLIRKRFKDAQFSGLKGGMHLAWKLPADWPTADAVCERALDLGVGVYSANTGAATLLTDSEDAQRYLVLGYCALSEAEIADGIERLATLLPSGAYSDIRTNRRKTYPFLTVPAET